MSTIRTSFRGERSHTLILMKLLSDGNPWTPPQLADASGLTLIQVYNSMRNLRKGAWMRSLPQPYQITPAGLECLAERLERREELAFRPQKRKVPSMPVPADQDDDSIEDEPFQHRITAAPAERDAVVEAAVSRRHAFESAWGASR